ncbi:MAG: PAS domain S-box protein, partial [Vicinamibacterales bacterium]
MGNFDPAKHLGRILASLVEISDDAIVVTDLDAVIMTWSPGASRLYGYAANEMVGQSMALLLLEEQKKLVPEHYARLRAGQRVEHFETRRVTKHGRVVEVSAVLTPVNDEDGAVAGVLSVTRDIRGQKRSDAALQASEGRWRAVVESAVDGIVMIDARGRIEAFNPAAERLFGYAEREVVGKNVSMLMPSPYHEEHDG